MEAGQVIASRFTIIGGLGSGGNATVWRVSDATDSTEKALKVLTDYEPSSESYRRFAFEVEVHRQIGVGVRGVVPIVESSLPDAPTPENPAWATMPIATPLRDTISGATPLREIVAILRELASTLAALHDRGISHRDIKPSNLFVLDGPSFGDFGLASYPEKPAITTNARQVGARNFTAPEMIRDPKGGDGKNADVFSLALTFWVLACDQKWPLPGEYDADRAPYRIRDYRADADRSRALDRLIQRATHVSPDARPTMADFANELRVWLEPKLAADEEDLTDLLAEYDELLASRDRQERAAAAIQRHRERIRGLIQTSVTPVHRRFVAVVKDAAMGEAGTLVTDFLQHDKTLGRGNGPGFVFLSSQGTLADTHLGLGIRVVFDTETVTISTACVVRLNTKTNGGFGDYERPYAESTHTTVPLESAQEERAFADGTAWLNAQLRRGLAVFLEHAKRNAERR